MGQESSVGAGAEQWLSTEQAERRHHASMQVIGLRATATAAGLFKLTCELKRAGVLDEGAVDRIKDAMVKELCLTRPPSAQKEQFEQAIRHRLDALFSGAEHVSDPPPAEIVGQPS